MPIRFGIIGTSWITDSFIKSAQETGAWQLAAVYSRSEETAKTFGAKYGVTTTYTSVDALAHDSGVAAVYIASPNSLHYAHAAELLQAGKHVIVEKPATSTLAEFDKLVALAREKKVFLIEAYRHIQEANFAKAKTVGLQKVGPLYGASLNYASYSSRYDAVLAGELPNVFSPKLSAGSLVDLGVYPIMAAVALFGRPKSAVYHPILIPGAQADAGGIIVLVYGPSEASPSGFAVSIHASKCYTSTAPSEVYGQNGTLVINATTDIDRVDYIDARSKRVESLAGPKAPLNLMEEAAEFARIIEEQDWDAAEKLQDMGRAVLEVTVELRRQNGIVFDAEK